MNTVIRIANLLDILAVVQQQDTPRGVEEMAQAQLITGGITPDALAADLFLRSSFTYAMTTEDAPAQALAVAGFMFQRPGVYRSWMFALDEAWEKHGTALTEHTAKALRDMLENAHRIEVICLNSRERVHRWYNRIGLQKEATLTRYCSDGTDAALFVLTRSEH
jgi:hypothetical protein